MDILYACTLYPPAIGGAQIHLHCMARQMQAMGHGVRVLASASRNRTDWLSLSTIRPEPRRDHVHEGVPVSQLGYPLSARLRMAPWTLAYYAMIGPATARLAQVIGEQAPWPARPPSVVHVSRVGREFLARAALDYARRQNVPYVLTPNHHPRWRGYLYREYDRIYRQADALFALTEAEKQTLVNEKNIPAEKVHVTGIGPVLSDAHSPEEFRARHGITGRFVLYLGQQLKYKGIASLLEAAPQIWKRHPDVRIVFIGPPSPYSHRLFAAVRDERLINLGSVDLRTKTSALAACELLCLPSVQESFGGVFVEAWSLRKPVIGGRIPPIAAVIDEGVNGLLTSQQPDEIASSINRLLDSDRERETMGQAGWAKVQAKYSWEQIARQTLAVYESVGATTAAPQRKASRPIRHMGRPASGNGNGHVIHRRANPGALKVLLTHNFYKQLGGEDLSFADEADLLESRGHDVVRYTMHNDSIDSMSGWGASKRAIWNDDAFRRIAALIDRERPDILHCTNTFPLISPAVYYAARKAGVPVVQSLRNYRVLCLNATLLREGKVCEECVGRSLPWPGVAHGCYRQSRAASAVVATMSGIHNALRTWTRAVDLYYTLTEFSRQKFIQGGLPAERIAVKPNFVNPDPGLGRGDGGYAVFAGRLSQEKGIDTLLSAWAGMPDRPRLKIIGDGPMADRVREAAARDDAIEWLGHRPLREVLDIIGGARCLVIPSIWYETFGRTIIEAFAKGTPVIASRLGAMAELVEHGRTGLLFEPANADDLRLKVRQLLAEPACLANMRRAARAEYESKHTAENNYRHLMNIYHRAMNPASPIEDLPREPLLAVASS